MVCCIRWPCLQELLGGSVPVPTRLGAVGEIAQVAKHTRIGVDRGQFADLVAAVGRVWTDIAKDGGEDFGGQSGDVIVAGAGCRPGEVDGCVGCLFMLLGQLGARSEVLEKAHDASVPGSVVSRMFAIWVDWGLLLPSPWFLSHPWRGW